MYRFIIVPLDGSVTAESALSPALSLAKALALPIELVTVQPPLLQPGGEPTGAVWASWEEAAVKRIDSYLASAQQRVADAAGVEVTTRVLHGPVESALETFLSARSGDLVVMTTHGRGRFMRAWLGSVASHVVRHCSVPVLLVRPAGEEVPPLEVSPLPRRILVPLDHSRWGEQILPHAIEFARAAGGSLTLLHVVVPPYVIESPYIADAGGADPALLGEAQGAAEQYVAEVAERVRSRGVPVDVAVATSWMPASAILEHAEAADLIAMTTHGRSGMQRLLMGSVADKVMRAAERPVLFFRPVEQ